MQLQKYNSVVAGLHEYYCIATETTADFEFDGTPCAVKAARTVWSGGKSGDYIKGLPIAIWRQISGHEAVHG